MSEECNAHVCAFYLKKLEDNLSCHDMYVSDEFMDIEKFGELYGRK